MIVKGKGMSRKAESRIGETYGILELLNIFRKDGIESNIVAQKEILRSSCA